MRKTTTTVMAAALLLLAGCSGPSEGDRVACETVIDAQNTETAMAQDVLATEMRDRGPVRDLLISHSRGIPDRIDEARSVAEAPELRIALDRAARLADYDRREEEAGVAYRLLLNDVERACQDAGVDVTLDR